MITDQELRQFIEEGAVTIDTPLTEAQIAAASAAFDRRLPFSAPQDGRPPRYRVSMTCSCDDPELLEIIQHPFFEEVAKRALRAQEVQFFQTAITTSYPEPDTPFSFDQHVDIQYSLSDLNAVPRGMVCSYFLWLSDVNERRAPMMVRPRSHWLIAGERERHPELRDGSPRVSGASLAQLPALAYADPVPLVARAGQVSVLTTATVHGASVNVDTEPRKAMVITFTAAGVEIGLPTDQAEQKRAYDRELSRRLRPERAHIVAA
jgi:ectoine hydroxylase-related dioxygenase (phytanoyl-CoA dioxygenase family)